MPLLDNVCKSCGIPYGQVLDYWDEKLHERVSKVSSGIVNPGNIAFMQLPAEKVEMGDILDELHIDKLCCRTSVLTRMNFMDYLR